MLPAHLRETFGLRRKGLSNKEIAEQLDVSEKNCQYNPNINRQLPGSVFLPVTLVFSFTFSSPFTVPDPPLAPSF